MRVYVFDNKNGESYIYMTGSKLSSGGLLENSSIVAEIKYDGSERKAFDIAKNNILASAVSEFHSVGEDEIMLLAERGDIVARITDRKIPRISEMYGNKENVIGEQIYDEGASNSIIDSNDFEDVNIDIDTNIGVRKNVVLETEKEFKKEKNEKDAILKRLNKSEKDLEKLYKKPEEKTEEKKKATILMSSVLDYSKMNTLMIEANKIVEKGAGAGEIKVPKSIADNLAQFFDYDNSFKLDENNRLNSVVTFDVFDNRSNKLNVDENTLITNTDKGLAIKSSVIDSLGVNEGDIVRIIKENFKKYRCEIIRKDTEEYNLWERYLVNSIRGQKRRYGIT